MIKKEFKSLITGYGRMMYIRYDYDGDLSELNKEDKLYDYLKTLNGPTVFYYISLFEVDRGSRNKGRGRNLLMGFFNVCNPKTILLECGLLDNLVEYSIENDIKEFWIKNGFIDINFLNKTSGDQILMIWPNKEANRVKSFYNRGISYCKK